MDLTDGALKSAQTFTELETVKVGGSNIIGLQKWTTYNGSDAHDCHVRIEKAPVQTLAINLEAHRISLYA